MSRHTFQRSQLLITVGFDRPQNHFFLDIEDNNGKIIFSNFNWKDPFPKQLQPIEITLEKIGISMPVGLKEELEADKRDNVGNKLKCWE